MTDIQKRLDFIDLLRGLVICLMVLDHTRDFVHYGALAADPLDLKSGGPLLYMTRWITHLCAPTFVFLSGLSIFLQKQNGKTGWPLSRFLLTRGLWLVFLELTVVNFGFDLKPGIFLQVIWAIGVSMIFMAALVHLPRLAVLAIGAIIVGGHVLLAPIDAPNLPAVLQLPWSLLMEPAFNLPLGGFNVYPAIPWLGIMCLGYGLAPVTTDPGPNRSRNIALMAVASIALFLCLRVPNLYGNPVPWTMPANPSEAPFAVLNVFKYPPSLHYALITLGIAMLLMLALPKLPPLAQKPLLAFGRTPMLTYLLHIYVAHGLAILIGLFQGVPIEAFWGHMSDPSRTIAAHAGVPLWATYLVWLVVLAILYPMSSAWAKYRATHKHWWTSYL